MSDKTSIAALRQWSLDAAAVFNGWSGTTYSATKDAQLKEIVRRLGLLMTNLADVLEHNSFSD